MRVLKRWKTYFSRENLTSIGPRASKYSHEDCFICFSPHPLSAHAVGRVAGDGRECDLSLDIHMASGGNGLFFRHSRMVVSSECGQGIVLLRTAECFSGLPAAAVFLEQPGNGRFVSVFYREGGSWETRGNPHDRGGFVLRDLVVWLLRLGSPLEAASSRASGSGSPLL